MEDISLHLMDIMENSITSGASRIEVTLEQSDEGLLTVKISDNGSGMDEASIKRAIDPFYTTKARKRFGLGLALLKQSAEETEGSFSIDSAADVGTTVCAMFHADHPDMRPLGDIAGTISLMRVCHPEIEFGLEC